MMLDPEIERLVHASYSDYLFHCHTYVVGQPVVHEYEWRAMCMATLAVQGWLALRPTTP